MPWRGIASAQCTARVVCEREGYGRSVVPRRRSQSRLLSVGRDRSRSDSYPPASESLLDDSCGSIRGHGLLLAALGCSDPGGLPPCFYAIGIFGDLPLAPVPSERDGSDREAACALAGGLPLIRQPPAALGAARHQIPPGDRAGDTHDVEAPVAPALDGAGREAGGCVGGSLPTGCRYTRGVGRLGLTGVAIPGFGAVFPLSDDPLFAVGPSLDRVDIEF